MYVCMYVTDQIDRDVRHGQLLMTMMMTMMYVCEEMITTTIEQITKRRRMTAVEREALQISCDRCGKQFSRPQDLKRHNNLMPQCGTVKRRMTVAERAKLPFKCEKCGDRFSRQQDIARHKCSSSSRTTSSGVNQTK